MNFIVYDANGNIVRTGSCPDDHIQLQAGPGEFAMAGQARDNEHIIKNGKIVAKPKPAPQPEQPEQPEQVQPKIPSLQQQILAIMAGGKALDDMKKSLQDLGLIKLT